MIFYAGRLTAENQENESPTESGPPADIVGYFVSSHKFFVLQNIVLRHVQASEFVVNNFQQYSVLGSYDWGLSDDYSPLITVPGKLLSPPQPTSNVLN